MAKEVDIKPHTINISLGLFGGKQSLLPGDKILSTTTMCGHGLIATTLVQNVIEKIENGELALKDGAQTISKHCPCALFNMDRFEGIVGGKEEKS
jgi:hypothetical protein